MNLSTLLAEAEALALRPGETLIIHLADDREMDAEHLAVLHARIEAHFPENRVVVIAADKVVVETEPSIRNEVHL